MAMNDILPVTSIHGGPRVVRIEIDTAGFSRGEPVRKDISSGGVLVSPEDETNPLAAEIFGIACEPVDYSRNGTTTTRNPLTGAAYAQGDSVAIWVPSPGVVWRTRWFTTAVGSDFNNAAPAQADIGDPCALVWCNDAVHGAHWGIEIGTMDFACGRILDVVQISTGKSIQGTPAQHVGAVSTTLLNGLPDYWVYFEILAHQGAPTAVSVGDPA